MSLGLEKYRLKARCCHLQETYLLSNIAHIPGHPGLILAHCSSPLQRPLLCPVPAPISHVARSLSPRGYVHSPRACASPDSGYSGPQTSGPCRVCLQATIGPFSQVCLHRVDNCAIMLPSGEGVSRRGWE